MAWIRLHSPTRGSFRGTQHCTHSNRAGCSQELGLDSVDACHPIEVPIEAQNGRDTLMLHLSHREGIDEVDRESSVQVERPKVGPLPRQLQTAEAQYIAHMATYF